MPVPPPPPPPPPPAAVQAPIPKSNKQLLQSIEKGKKLKKVPETCKNDRSSGLVAAGVASNNSSARQPPSTQGAAMAPKSYSNDSSNDFQSQLRNKVLNKSSGNNGLPENKGPSATSGYTSVRPPQNQPFVKPPPPAAPTKPLSASSSSASLNNDFNNRPPPPIANYKPPVTRDLNNRQAPRPPIKAAVNDSTTNQFQTANRIAPPITPQPPLNHNRMPLAGGNRPPAPNQFQGNHTRPPPPPPTKSSKPVQRNSVSMEISRPVSVAPPPSDLAPKPKPTSYEGTVPRRNSAVTRQTTDPPPPLPGQFKPVITRPAVLPPAPPLPSRLSSGPPYKVADRPPPPPPPPSSALTKVTSAFDRRFRFPDVSDFPRM